MEVIMEDMKKCPKCGQEMSLSAKTCSNCENSLKKKKGCGRTFLIILGVIVGIGILSAIGNNAMRTSTTSASSTEPSSTAPQATGNSSSSQTHEEILIEALPSIDIHRVSTTSNMITIEFDVSDNFTNDMIQDGAKIDVTHILQALHDEISFSYGTVDIHGRLPLIDRYGNREIGNVIELRYRKPALDRINWSGFQWTNVYDIAEYVWMHPAFE